MKNLLFENTYFASQELLKIYSKQILANRFQKQFYILSAIFLLLLIVSLVTKDQIAAGLTGGLLLISLIATFAVPYLMFKQILNMQKKLHNGKTPETLVQIGEQVRLKEGKCDITFDYQQITEIYFLPKIYVLMFGKSNGVMMKSDGFTLGNSEDFRKFITERCPNAKIFQKD